MAIHDWPADQRPRERLLEHGPGALSDAELLAIFLRNGVRGKSAVELAGDLLAEFGGFSALIAASQSRLCRAGGLGPAKYAQLQATLELARRHLREPLRQGDALTQPQQVRELLQAQLAHLPQEVFHVLFLDNRHRVIRDETLFYGTINSASVHPREVVRRALEHNAAALIVAHNHPSGVAEPSRADIDITRRLRDAAALVDIRLLDHIVVGGGEAISLAERGCL